MNSILFVDDEPGVLGGLRDSLRKYRSDWNMTFVSSGNDALAALAAAPFDVVVSDMRMPHMDGTALLTRIKAEFPRTARIILSGHADRDAIVRALPVTHQFLTKPCPPEQMRRVIERTCSLNSLMGSETIRRLIGGLDKLPSVPRTYDALRKAMGRDDVKIAEVAAIVEQDAAMSVKILQLVNSAYFGTAHRMTSIRQAVTFLGLELLRALVLSAQVFGVLEEAALRIYGLESVHERSMRTAQLARLFLKEAGLADEGFTAGLVHDVGRIILAVCLEDRYRAVTDEARRSGALLHVVEQQVLGVTHAQIGAYLLGMWGLPAVIVEAVAFHHAPCDISHDEIDVVGAVHVAEALVAEALGGTGSSPVEGTLDAGFLQKDGVPAKVAHWRTLAAAQVLEKLP